MSYSDITKNEKHSSKVTRVSRRRWLQSVAASMALPSLEIFTMDKAFAQSQHQNFLVYFLPNGRNPEHWKRPLRDGKFDFGEYARGLIPFSHRMAMGLDLTNTPAMKSSPNAAHAKGCSTVLTATQGDLTKITNNISIDQIIANHVGKDSNFKSLQYTSASQATNIRCDANGTSCVYTQTVSWAGRGKPLATNNNVKTAFNQLFGPGSGFKPMAKSGGIDETSKYMTSVLDALTQDATDLKKALGMSDQERLEQYFEGIRDIEKRLQTTGLECSIDNFQLPDDEDNFPEHVEAFQDLIVLALSCGQTKVISYMIDYGLSQRFYRFIGAGENHHAASHYNREHEKFDVLKIEQWQSDRMGSLLEKLDSTIGANGKSLLDETLVLLMPSMGDGNTHNHRQVCPIFVGGDGTIRTDGRTFPKQELANVHVTLLDAFGIEGNFGRNGMRFGDNGNKTIQELL